VRPKTAARSWPWLLSLAAAIALLHLPYLWPGGPWARLPVALYLGQDEGTVLYDSWRIDQGQVMYRDFFEFQGPIFYYLHAALFALTGPSITAARALHLLVTAAGSTLLAVVVARFAGRLVGLGAAAIHAFILLPMWPFAYPAWLAEALALAGLALVARDETRPRDEILGGACFGLSLMTIQSVGLPVLVAAAAAAAAPGLAAREARRALLRPARIILGAAAAILPILLYFAAHGALGSLGYAMFRWSLHNYRLGQGPAVTYAWFVDQAIRQHLVVAAPWRWFHILGLGITWVLPFLAVASAAVVAPLAAARLLRRRPLAPGEAGMVATAAAALAAVSPLWLAPIRPDLTHVAYLGSFGLIGLALLARLLIQATPRAQIATNAMVATAGAAMLLAYSHKTVYTWSASRALGNWREVALTLPSARQVDDVVSPGGTIVVGAMGGFYYLFLRPAAVAHTYIPATYAAYLDDAQWRRLADDIAVRRPEAMLFVGRQWSEITKRRPDLAARYRNDGGLLRLR
jgi:hypothetical protein